MLGTLSELSPLRLDDREMTKTFDKILGQIIRESARQWLRTWLSLGVPVETGMAKATLQPLGRFLRVRVNVRARRKPYFSKLEGTQQSPASGETAQDFKITDDKSNPRSFMYGFEWSTSVLHYMLREFYRGAAVPGEDAIEEALKAFENHLVTTIERRLPIPLELNLKAGTIRG